MISVGNPLASFEIADTVCVGTLVQMNNTSSSGVYAWNFGTGAFPVSSTQRNPIVRFNTEGTYNISLTVTSTDGLCSSDTTITVFADLVDAGFTAVPDYSCFEPVDVVFTPNTTDAMSYLWVFGDGTTSTMENPTHTYDHMDTTIFSQNGILDFEVELTVRTRAGCVATFKDTIIIHEPNAWFMPDVVDGCAPVTVQFSDSSTSNENIVSWEWIYGTAGTNTFTNGNPHSFTFTDPGEYDVVLIIENAAGCRDTSYAVRIEVGEPITPNFTADKSTICPGDTVFFQDLTNNANIDEWHFDTDDRRSFHCFNENELMWAFGTEAGSFDATLTVGYNGCYTSTTVADIVTVNGPIAQIDYMVTCETPYDIMFIDSSHDATSITWDFGDTTNSTLDSLVHTYDTSGVYQVILTAENAGTGCPASMDTIDVHVRDIHAEFFVGEMDTLLCLGEMYDLNASMTTDVDANCWRGFTWFFEDTRPITTQDTIIPRPFNTPGKQTVTLVAMDINGCLDTAQVDVEVFTVTAKFSVDKPRICFPSTVMFSDSSFADTTMVSWMWDFAGFGTSEDQNPTFTFSNPTVPLPDSLLVTLLVTDTLGCGGSESFYITVYEPTSLATADPDVICEGDQIMFSATDFTQEGSFLTYDWVFGNGLTSTLQSNTVTYPNPGQFTVSLTYTEDSTGCQNDTMFTVDVEQYPMAEFASNLDGLPFICHPQQIALTSTTTPVQNYNYEWSINNQLIPVNMPNITSSLGRGTFDVQMIVSTVGAGCRDTFNNSYTLVCPEGDFTLNPTAICEGETITVSLIDTIDVTSFSWDFGNGVIIDNVDPATFTYDNIDEDSTNFRITLILRGENDACEFPVVKVLQLRDVNAGFEINGDATSDPVNVCINDLVSFTNTSSGADNFQWDFDDNNANSTDVNPTYTFTQSGTYQVQLAIQNLQFGCVDTLIRTVSVSAPEPADLAVDNACAGDTTTLTINQPNPDVVYEWFPSNLLSDPTTISSVEGTVPLFDDTQFILTQTNTITGCILEDTVDVLVVQQLPAFTWDTLVCQGESVNLPIVNDGRHTFSWEPSSGLSCPGSTDLNCSFPLAANLQEPITYVVDITDNLGLMCPEVSDTFNILVPTESPRIPNAFTPDADGNNDFFNVVFPGSAIQLVTISKFQVFNRWGTIVYDNSNPARGWDGMYKGKLAPSEVYVYVIEIKTGECLTSKLTGDVTLIR